MTALIDRIHHSLVGLKMPRAIEALHDRLLHHAVVIQIEGASYRMRQHADLVPEHARTNAPITPPPPKKRGRPHKKQDNGG